jgi:hypothetical protein
LQTRRKKKAVLLCTWTLGFLQSASFRGLVQKSNRPGTENLPGADASYMRCNMVSPLI